MLVDEFCGTLFQNTCEQLFQPLQLVILYDEGYTDTFVERRKGGRVQVADLLNAQTLVIEFAPKFAKLACLLMPMF